MSKLRIGILGFGTVGGGVYKTLKSFDNVEIKKILVRDITRPRNIAPEDKHLLTDNAQEIITNPEIDVIVELMGGLEPAGTYIRTALENGKHIVTANKELLAKQGKELFELSEKHNKVILYEAAVAGGIPVIMPVKTILAGNKINKIQAILNGTTNYILTKMDKDGADYETVLKEAQQMGYAEADPTSDVEGFDTAYKITTLATIAFGKRVNIDNVYREGISKIKLEDIKAANELDHKIKLIALASMDEEGRADVRVHPMLVPNHLTLAHIDYVTNAVEISGHPIGKTVLSGPGAGEFPTASSVVGDILAISAEFGKTDYILPMMRCKHSENAIPVKVDDTINKYYLSITAPNAIGIIGKIGTICAKKNISLSSIVQKGVKDDNTANIIVITELCREADIKQVIEELNECKINSLIRVAI